MSLRTSNSLINLEKAGFKDIEKMTEHTNFQITIAIQDSDLDNEELQEETQNLLEQIEESETVEKADLVAVDKAPEGSKALGGFIIGMLTTEVGQNNVNSLIRFLKNFFMGGDNKKIELELKTPDGRDIKVTASSREDVDYVFQKVQEWEKQ